MRRILLASLLACVPTIGLASAPEPVVTVRTTYNGYATVGGRLAERPDGPVGVTVTNGNVATSTVTDPEGRWSVVFQQRAMSFDVSSWSMTNTAERSAVKRFSLGD